MSASKPVVVFTPAGGLTPSHYGYISYLLLQAGYPTISGLLPSLGPLNAAKSTCQDDADYIRERLVMPMLENEQRDVVVVGHSYSSIPASGALKGLGKSERAAQGKKTSVIGQINIAGFLPIGGDGNSLLAASGGNLPPHMRKDEPANLVRCDTIVASLMQDVDPKMAKIAAEATLCPSISCFDSPVPRATWDAEEYKGRIAYVKTLSDHAVPAQLQTMFLEANSEQWIVKEIDTGHCPMLSQPENLAKILIELTETFQNI